MTVPAPPEFLRELFKVALAAADPALAVPNNLPPPPSGRTIVVGAGKAAAAMARAVEDHWSGPITGLVATRYGHAVECRHIEVVEAAHPVPDQAGRKAAARILETVQGLNADDLVLCLISGGGSALLALPAPGLTLEDKQGINRALLASGANIAQMNCVRKHLSAIKGGRLAAAAAPARVVTLVISDVPGDDPAIIASGPTVPDPTSLDDARAILQRYGIAPPRGVLEHLTKPEAETPKPGDPRLDKAETILITRPQDALEAAAARAEAAGITPVILGDALEGEARDMARDMAGAALQAQRDGAPAAPPCVLLSGGEATVTVRGTGRGGPNVEFLLALAIALNGAPGIFGLACDTDGIDGTEDNAGALIGPDTLARAREVGLDPAARLADNDSYGLFDGLGDLVMTGPTLTNVNDFRAILVLAES